MAAFLAKQAVSALSREKPHSSITDWVEILTSSRYEIEAYDGIPELVDSINIQGTEGTGEASRAIRKKLKHGNTNNQLRALVILKALVENCGPNFQNNFADDRLLEAIRGLASDHSTDPAVKKKVLIVLASWKRQFEGEPRMRQVATLYDQYKPVQRRSEDHGHHGPSPEDLERERERELQREREREEKEAAKREKEEAKKRAKKEKEEERERRLRDAKQPKTKRKPFNIAEEKPKILNSIVLASQASSNLVNALMLVNVEKEPVETNSRVQECLANAKTVRKQLVRYIQLVEDEELIGTLLETNERIIQALEMYDRYLIPDNETGVEGQLARTKLSESNASVASELNKLREKQRAAVVAHTQSQRGRDGPGGSSVYPDLQDLEFGGNAPGLPEPLRPQTADSDEDYGPRGSLSDFSDYDSSDEETHNRALKRRALSASPSGKGKGHQQYSSYNSDDDPRGGEPLIDDSDPFADPQEVPTPGISSSKQTSWL
ncbi:hypothetical protein M422DRAFT_54196 [Sphaerobolus stellatus SS14]|uniref:VHS domain-containing protein n=1 Tax=Sphaerobolus stellatus (strain SS14) TaxID=990650 RepID=A0A0C9U508_SPHS4|nr:hypothetical protein M422DRAFT_54196 [Sphaerobolus stellatus SS14]